MSFHRYANLNLTFLQNLTVSTFIYTCIWKRNKRCISENIINLSLPFNLKKSKVYQVNNRTFFHQCSLNCVLIRASWDHPSGVVYTLWNIHKVMFTFWGVNIDKNNCIVSHRNVTLQCLNVHGGAAGTPFCPLPSVCHLNRQRTFYCTAEYNGLFIFKYVF